MQNDLYNVLLIEDNPDDAELVKDSLSISEPYHYEIAHVSRLADASKIISHITFDVILLDLSLPDSFGLDSFTKLHEQIPDTPIIILTGFKDEATAIQSVQIGAQDYIVKDFSDPSILTRAIRFAIERHKHWAALQNMVLVDELTGLYNRRGFWTLSEQLMKMLKRSEDSGYMVYVDLDNMKSINDTYGHAAGDQALITTAKILRETFRESDVIARIGGDEFAVAAVISNEYGKDKILSRLQTHLDNANNQQVLDFSLSISTGIVSVDPDQAETTEQILAKADKAMYEIKQAKKSNV